MWKIQKRVEGEHLVLAISGRIEEPQLAQLENVLIAETWNDGAIVDLKDVKLVDQAGVTFLAAYEGAGRILRNCPSYIREWINREKGISQGQAFEPKS
jgi:hypothetical protein